MKQPIETPIVVLKGKLYPNSTQRTELAKTLGCGRKIFNLCLAESERLYKEEGVSMVSLPELSKYFHNVLLKTEEFSYLKEQNTKILKSYLNDLACAFKNFFKDKKVGYPNYKKKENDSCINLQYEAISKKVFDVKGKVFINKTLGLMKYRMSKEYTEVLEKYKEFVHRISIRKDNSDTYFIMVYIYTYIPELRKPHERTNRETGCDRGIKDILICSDGTKYPNPKYQKKAERMHKHLQRSLSKKELVPTDKTYFSTKWKKDVVINSPSNNRYKARVKLARHTKKVLARKKDYMHYVSKQIATQYDFVAMETLNTNGMMKNHNLAKSLQESNMGELGRMIQYKCGFYGTKLVYIGRFFPSSKMCNHCKDLNTDLKLSDREWTCMHCGVHHDRDINAAKNILEEGKRIFMESLLE